MYITCSHFHVKRLAQALHLKKKQTATQKWKLSLHMSQVAHQAGAYPGLSSMKRLGIFLLPLDRRLVHRKIIPNIKFASTYLYSPVKRGSVRVKCLAENDSTMFLARLRPKLLEIENKYKNQIIGCLHRLPISFKTNNQFLLELEHCNFINLYLR